MSNFGIDDAIAKCKDRARISALHHMMRSAEEWEQIATWLERLRDASEAVQVADYKHEPYYFRQNIRTLCEEQGITLAEVMEKAGYNVNHLHHLACKHLPPTEEAVRCYAKALGVEPERLKEGFDDY